MEIVQPAMAGTLESSDCQVTVEPGNNGIELNWRVWLSTSMEIR